MKKSEAYRRACLYFQDRHPEWKYTVEKGCFIAQLDWHNSDYFDGKELTENEKSYRCVVKIDYCNCFSIVNTFADDIEASGREGISLICSTFANRDSWCGPKIDLESLKESEFIQIETLKNEIREFFTDAGFLEKQPKKIMAGWMDLLWGQLFFLAAMQNRFGVPCSLLIASPFIVIGICRLVKGYPKKHALLSF